MSLPEAIAKAVAIYRKEHNYWMERATAVKHMGYGSINGASATALATLIKYRLFEYGKGKEVVRATPLLISIAELRTGDPERVAAIREAATAPVIFAEFRDQFGDRLDRLPSHENMRSQLMRRGFNPRAVDDVIRAYRDTMAFVDEEGANVSTYHEDVDDMEDETPMEVLRTSIDAAPVKWTPRTREVFAAMALTNDASNPTEKPFRYALSGDCEVEFVYRGSVTQEAIEKFKKYLDLSKDAYPATAQEAKVAAQVTDSGHMLESGHDDGQEEA